MYGGIVSSSFLMRVHCPDCHWVVMLSYPRCSQAHYLHFFRMMFNPGHRCIAPSSADASPHIAPSFGAFLHPFPVLRNVSALHPFSTPPPPYVHLRIPRGARLRPSIQANTWRQTTRTPIKPKNQIGKDAMEGRGGAAGGYMNTHTHMHTKKPKRKVKRKRGKQRSVERKRGSKRGHPGKETKETHTRRYAGNIAHRARPGVLLRRHYILHITRIRRPIKPIGRESGRPSLKQNPRKSRNTKRGKEAGKERRIRGRNAPCQYRPLASPAPPRTPSRVVTVRPAL
jgi:hypothetical protein